MKKLHLGCGGHYLTGWDNHDMDVDITKPISYYNDSIDYIFLSHCVEHISQADCFKFLKECFRILKKDGVLRFTTPSLPKMIQNLTPEYTNFVKSHGWGDDPILAILSQHGHQNVASSEWFISLCNYIGFKSKEVDIYSSEYSELNNIEHHFKTIGHDFHKLESMSIECVK